MKRNRELNKCSKNRSMIDKYSGKERKYANKGTGQDFFFFFFAILSSGRRKSVNITKLALYLSWRWDMFVEEQAY